MTLEEFTRQRKYDIMRLLHETSTISGFRGYLMDKYEKELLREISQDMKGNPVDNEAFNIFCLGFYRGRMYEKERYIEKAPE